MIITFAGTVIVDGSETFSADLSVAGRRVVQESPLLRSAVAQVINRNNRSLAIQFRSSVEYATLGEAQAAQLTLFDTLRLSSPSKLETSACVSR